jgi:hypothetical protein
VYKTGAEQHGSVSTSNIKGERLARVREYSTVEQGVCP